MLLTTLNTFVEISLLPKISEDLILNWTCFLQSTV